MTARVWLGGAAALMIGALPAAAQEGSWAAWQGCWRATGEDAPQEVVCIAPGADAQSVRVVTVADGAIAGETLLRADGVARAVEESGCTGTESASFSADGRRVYTRAEMNCDGVHRTSTGILAMLTGAEWLDAQAVSVGEQHATRTIRYRAVEVPAVMAAALPERAMAVEAARLHAAAPLELEHVTEASRQLAAPVVEALLAARGHGYDLNARRLVQLRDQDVPGSTIDVMVALSYPEKFVVRERSAVNDVAGVDGRVTSDAFGSRCRDAYWRSSMRFSGDCYDRYGYGYDYGRYGYDRYGSSRYGYSPWGYDNYGWGRDPVVVVVVPADDNDNNGEVVKGRGYTRSAPSNGSATSRASRPSESAAGRSTTRSTRTADKPSTRSSEPKPAAPRRSAKPRGGN